MRQILRPSPIRTFVNVLMPQFRPVCTCIRDLSAYKEGWRQPRESSRRFPMGGRPRQQRASRPNILPWMKGIHQSLMKNVDMPPIRKAGSAFYAEDYLQELSVTDLMSQARAIVQVDAQSIKLIQALWRRFDSMTVEEILTVADIFFINGVVTPNYSSAMISYITEMFDLLPMTSKQITRLAFHISNHRHAPSHLMISIEKHLLNNLDDFDMDDICLICHSYFLSKTKIRSPILLDRVAEKFLSDFRHVTTVNVQMLMKTFRFSHFMKVGFYKQLGDLIIEHDVFSDARSMVDIMHVAFSYASLRITHDELMSYILRQYLNYGNERRLKDISKLMWACGTLVTDSEQHLLEINKILSQSVFLRESVLKYPDNLAECLMGLAYLDIYPFQLLNKLFNPQVVEVLRGFGSDRTKSMQLAFLDQSIAIECPQYKGNRLTESDRILINDQVEKHFSVETDAHLRKSLNLVIQALQKAFGEDRVACTNALPHVKLADVLLTYDFEREQFIKFSDNHLINGLEDDRQEGDKLKRIVVMVLSRAQRSYNGDRIMGLTHCKIRQLDRLGYNTVLIDPDEALKYMVMDLEEIQGSLLPKIYASLHS